MITVVWAFVVGGTGVINTWAEPMLDQWRTNELASMVASSAGGETAPSRTASLDKIVDNATKAAPGMETAFIAFPGTPFSSSHHFAAFMRGDRTLTSRLLKLILFDAATAEAADTRDLPFYLKALFISQPLHFGDYGGMPLKYGRFSTASRSSSSAAGFTFIWSDDAGLDIVELRCRRSS